MEFLGLVFMLLISFVVGFFFRQPQVDEMRNMIKSYEEIIKEYKEIFGEIIKERKNNK